MIGPSDGYAYTKIELEAIWDIPTPNVAENYSHPYAFHLKAATMFTISVTGYSDHAAAELIARAAIAEYQDPDTFDDPPWPCTIDHSLEAELEADGWIHGDPDTYLGGS